jgi:hypothetical protein
LSWDGLKALVLGWERMPAREQKAMRVRLWQSEIIGRKEGGEFGLARTVSGAKRQRGSRETQLPDVFSV